MIIPRNRPDSIRIVSDYLLKGRICILPCDTIYGIVGIYPETGPRIRDIKGREENKAFILLADQAIAETIFKNAIPEEIRKLWPGPLTVIDNDRQGSTTAVRVPDNEFLLQIISLVNKPVFSTSVNFSGQEAINDINEIKKQFESRVDLICEAEEYVSGRASTIIDISRKPYRIIRQGGCVVPSQIMEKYF